MNLVYLIKWRGCLNNVTKGRDVNILHISDEGALIETSDDADFINDALNNGCTAYARYYRFRIIRAGDLDDARKAIKPLDIWTENNVLNIVVNPLRLSTFDIAKILYGLDFELELVSEDDVEYTK